MKILITGANGQVGQDFLHYAKNKCTVFSFTHQALTITNKKNVHELIQQIHPDIVINAAAYTQVDLAETNKEEAFLVNATGIQHIASICASLLIPVIHLSTDYVFDGAQKIPYLETAPTHPLNIYGESKLLGEQHLQATHTQHIILRTSGVFSSHKINFVKKMLILGQQKTTLSIVNNQFFCPTATLDIAKTLYTLSEKIGSPTFSDWGIYHYCSKECVSWFDFATAIFNEAKNYPNRILKELIPISSEAYPTPAKRPAYSALNCEKIINHFAIEQPSWQTSLPIIISEYFA